MPSLINIQMELRKCCNHPYLIKGVEETNTMGLLKEELLASLLKVRRSLLSAHYSLLAAHCAVLTAYCLLPTALCSLLSALCSLLTAQS